MTGRAEAERPLAGIQVARHCPAWAGDDSLPGPVNTSGTGPGGNGFIPWGQVGHGSPGVLARLLLSSSCRATLPRPGGARARHAVPSLGLATSRVAGGRSRQANLYRDFPE